MSHNPEGEQNRTRAHSPFSKMMDAMAFPGAPYIRQYANSGGTSTPQSDQNTAASVENTTTNQVQPRSVGSPPLQPRATNDGAQARRSMPPLSDHHSSSRESLNSGIQANLPSLAQLRSRGDWYPSEGTSPSHPMYARRPEYEESGMTQSGQHTNPLSSEMQRAASGAQRPLPGSSAEGYLSRPQLPSIDESLFMRPRMHSSEMAGAIDEKRSNVDPRIAYSNSPGTYDELGWNTGYRPDRVVMPHDVGSPNFPHSASTTPPLGVREDPRYDYFRSHLNYPSSRSAFPPPLHQVAPSPSPMGRSTTTQLPPLSDHLRDVPGPRRFHRPQPSSHDGPIDGAYYLQQKRLYAESYNYPQRGPPPNFGAMHGLKADHEEGSDDGFEPSSRNFRSVLPNQRSPHHHPAEAPKPYETKPAPSPAPPDQEVLDIIQRIKNRSDMKSNKRKRANQTSGLPSAPSTIQNATSARSHDIQFWRRPVHALNPKLRECAAEARKNAKKGECPVTTDDRLTSIPETKRFLGSLVYGGPKLNTRRTGRLEVEDLNLWVLPRFSSDDLFGTIEVRVPGRFLTWRGNLAVEACAVWGTDIYTDDSDIVATIIHAGRYQPYDYPTQESSTPPGRNKPEVVSKYPPQDLVVTLRILPRLFRYTGCYRYGITSRGWGTSHDGESIRIETIAEVSRKVDMQGRKRQTERWGIGRDESILWVEGIRRVRKRRRVPIVRDNPDMDNVDDEDDEDVHVDIDGDDSDESEILEEGESSEEIKLETAVTKVQESNLDSEYAESNESLPHTTFQKKLEMVTRMEALQDDSSSSMEEVDEEIVVIEKREVLPLKTVRESVTVTFSDLDGTLCLKYRPSLMTEWPPHLSYLFVDALATYSIPPLPAAPSASIEGEKEVKEKSNEIDKLAVDAVEKAIQRGEAAAGFSRSDLLKMQFWSFWRVRIRQDKLWFENGNRPQRFELVLTSDPATTKDRYSIAELKISQSIQYSEPSKEIILEDIRWSQIHWTESGLEVKKSTPENSDDNTRSLFTVNITKLLWVKPKPYENGTVTNPDSKDQPESNPVQAEANSDYTSGSEEEVVEHGVSIPKAKKSTTADDEESDGGGSLDFGTGLMGIPMMGMFDEVSNSQHSYGKERKGATRKRGSGRSANGSRK